MSQYNLSSFVRTVPAGETAKIAMVGNFLFIQEAGSALLYRARDSKGQRNSVRMAKGEAQRFDEPYTEIEINNDSGSAQTVTVLMGRGSFNRPPDTAQTFGSVPFEDDTTPGATITIPANSARKGVYAYMHTASDVPVGHDGGLIMKPTSVSALYTCVQLLPGETVFMAYTGEISVGIGSVSGSATVDMWELV